MTENDAEYLHGLRVRAQAVLDELETEALAWSPEEKQQRRQIVERLRSVIDDAESVLGKGGAD